MLIVTIKNMTSNTMYTVQELHILFIIIKKAIINRFISINIFTSFFN